MLIGVGGIACVLLAILGEGIFLGLTDPAKDSVFTRPEFARSRSQHRGLLKSGGFCIVCAEVPVLLAIAEATEDDSADANAPQVLFRVPLAVPLRVIRSTLAV